MSLASDVIHDELIPKVEELMQILLFHQDLFPVDEWLEKLFQADTEGALDVMIRHYHVTPLWGFHQGKRIQVLINEALEAGLKEQLDAFAKGGFIAHSAKGGFSLDQLTNFSWRTVESLRNRRSILYFQIWVIEAMLKLRKIGLSDAPGLVKPTWELWKPTDDDLWEASHFVSLSPALSPAAGQKLAGQALELLLRWHSSSPFLKGLDPGYWVFRHVVRLVVVGIQMVTQPDTPRSSGVLLNIFRPVLVAFAKFVGIHAFTIQVFAMSPKLGDVLSYLLLVVSGILCPAVVYPASVLPSFTLQVFLQLNTDVAEVLQLYYRDAGSNKNLGIRLVDLISVLTSRAITWGVNKATRTPGATIYPELGPGFSTSNNNGYQITLNAFLRAVPSVAGSLVNITNFAAFDLYTYNEEVVERFVPPVDNEPLVGINHWADIVTISAGRPDAKDLINSVCPLNECPVVQEAPVSAIVVQHQQQQQQHHQQQQQPQQQQPQQQHHQHHQQRYLNNDQGRRCKAGKKGGDPKKRPMSGRSGNDSGVKRIKGIELSKID